jgi:hypothetical protein
MATLPSVGGDKDSWGAKLNTVLTDHETRIADTETDVATNAAGVQYVTDLVATVQTTVAGKADASTVYTKTSSDGRFVRTVNGGTPDVNGNVVVVPPGTGTVTKGDVGLGNADNTSDASKPVSTAQAAAIALKQDLIPHYADQAAAQAAADAHTIVNGQLVTWG